ncbi:MAG: hypothetical protein FWE79_01030 [Firmicutes bacterium]|nr:hypothetical protein [Bacillota bacterium]
MIKLHGDGTKTIETYGEIVETKFKCPCGKGAVEMTYENIPGFRDRYGSFNCDDCSKKYVMSFDGVNLGDAPEIDLNSDYWKDRKLTAQDKKEHIEIYKMKIEGYEVKKKTYPTIDYSDLIEYYKKQIRKLTTIEKTP